MEDVITGIGAEGLVMGTVPVMTTSEVNPNLGAQAPPAALILNRLIGHVAVAVEVAAVEVGNLRKQRVLNDNFCSNPVIHPAFDCRCLSRYFVGAWDL